jgi:2,5-diketo-D-gluconate reductase A
LVRIEEEGRARHIGVSNFLPEHLTRIADETGVWPVLNQVELHPRLPQAELRAFHAEHNVVTQSWSPLGRASFLTDPVLSSIAAKHGRTAAQVIIRWHLDLGLCVIPKSVTPSRIVENFQVFDFSLDAADLAAIESLASDTGRIGPNPANLG